jgi:glyoxylate/hydroxypyruvate reductase A
MSVILEAEFVPRSRSEAANGKYRLMTRITLMTTVSNQMTFLEDHLKRAVPDATIIHWPERGSLDGDIVVCWKPPAGVMATMPNLRLIHSIAAGVDNVLADPALPDHPVCRIVDPLLGKAMAEYVLWGTLYFHRDFDRVATNARIGHWHRYDQAAAADKRVGILGLGTLGIQAARLLQSVGYRVSGWSRSAKQVDGVEVFAGDAAFDPFLAQADILVCLLPLTPSTTGILNAERLACLPKDAGLVLCSRGEHLVVPDLVASLRSGHLRGAVLDVFQSEPLQPDDPLWTEPGILVTPHMAGLAKPRVIADQIAENIRRLGIGEALLNRIDPSHGY